jgi:hypothetical protein
MAACPFEVVYWLRQLKIYSSQWRGQFYRIFTNSYVIYGCNFFDPRLFLAYFSKVGLCELNPGCVSVYPLPHQLLNAWTNLCETWYVYHCTWAHLKGLLHKSVPSVCVPVCVSLLSLLDNCSVKFIPPFFASQLLGRHVPAATNTLNSAICVLSKERLCVCLGRRRFLCGPCHIRGGSVAKKKNSFHEPREAWRQDELTGGKLPVVK